MFPDWEVSDPNWAKFRGFNSRWAFAIGCAADSTRVVLALCEGVLRDRLRKAPGIICAELEVVFVLATVGCLCCRLLAAPAQHFSTVAKSKRSGVNRLAEAAHDAVLLPDRYFNTRSGKVNEIKTLTCAPAPLPPVAIALQAAASTVATKSPRASMAT